MTIWTTFCPSKICWELTFAATQGEKSTSDWLKNQELIKDSLRILKKHGIAGIRLVIFPSELTSDGKRFDWTAIETMLDMCHRQKIVVDLCLGPYQYPYYPGIYLPQQLFQYVYDNENAMDTNPELRRYGITFLQHQLEKYGEDKRIRGFHLANEWPDRQNISGKEKLKKSISEDFMIKAASLIKSATEKPISLNTNINASDKKRITNTFTNILTIIGSQANLGFDIYPSEETWITRLLQMLRRFFVSSSYTFRQVQKALKDCTLYFAEIEAQPWGDGRSWYKIIKSQTNSEEKVLSYSSTALQQTWNNYIKRTNCDIVSLWGSDFWLVANELGITWPLKVVKSISSQAA